MSVMKMKLFKPWEERTAEEQASYRAEELALEISEALHRANKDAKTIEPWMRIAHIAKEAHRLDLVIKVTVVKANGRQDV